MQKGFNSDVNYRGQTYHIQTEDWGVANPFIVSRVFQNGAVLLTFKTPYSDIPGVGAIKSEVMIKQALRRQHSDTMDKLISGKLI